MRNLLRYEIKIGLPIVKIIYSVCFVVLLSMVRGISDVDEIGITLDSYMALLAIVFCADALQTEYTGKRWEIFTLYSEQSRKKALFCRIAVQCFYLWMLSVPGYFCFFWQQPRRVEPVSEGWLFLLCLGAVIVSVWFWGMAAFTLSNLCGSSWAGIGSCVILWLFAYSTRGEKILGSCNVFAFVFRDLSNPEDMRWIWGKGIALALTILMAVFQPRKKVGS